MNLRARLRTWGVRHIEILLLLAMTIILIAVIDVRNPAWFSLTTLQAAISENAAEAIVAVAMTFSIISGNIDLSPGSMVALCGVIIGLVFAHTHSLLLGIVAGLSLALGVGLAHGFLVGKLRINAIIVTLAAYIWASGMAVGLSRAKSISINTGFVGAVDNASFLGISVPLFVIAAAYILGWYLLNRSTMGRYTFAIGGDARAAQRAGVNVLRQVILIFGFMGLMIGVATVITVAQAASAQPYAAQGLEFDVIIAVIIGGTRLTGGEGSMLQTAAGVLFISLLNSGLGNLALPDADVYFIKGIVILVALSITAAAHRLARYYANQRPPAPVPPQALPVAAE